MNHLWTKVILRVLNLWVIDDIHSELEKKRSNVKLQLHCYKRVHEARVNENTLRRCATVKNTYEVILVCGVTQRKAVPLIKNLVRQG